jgi:hypothetical protein
VSIKQSTASHDGRDSSRLTRRGHSRSGFYTESWGGIGNGVLKMLVAASEERRVDMQHAVVTSSYELAKGVVNSQKSGVVYPCVL